MSILKKWKGNKVSGTFFTVNPSLQANLRILALAFLMASELTSSGAAATEVKLNDAHAHMPRTISVATIISNMDQAGVSKIVLMPQRRNIMRSAEESLAAYEQYPDRVIPYIGLNGLHDAKSITITLLDYVDQELAKGVFRGMGEFHGLHYGISDRTRGGAGIAAPQVAHSLDSPGAQDLMCLAAKHNIVFVIHMETTDEKVAELERALRSNPDTKVIWAHQNPLKTAGGSTADHARRYNPDGLAALMGKYQNLYADIVPGREILFYDPSRDHRLPENWKKLYENYSDRFVVGSDIAFAPSWQEGRYLWQVQLMRDWLSQLSPAAQEKFAHKNIENILAAKLTKGKACSFKTR